MNLQRKKDYLVFAGVFAIFIMMLPKVCAEPSSSVEVSADKASSLTEKLVTYSKEFLGCPYKSGSTGPATFDCSSFSLAQHTYSRSLTISDCLGVRVAFVLPSR